MNSLMCGAAPAIARVFGLVGLLSLLAAAVGCGPTVEVREFPEKNPTSYVFRASVREVKEAILQAFSRHAYRSMALEFRDNAGPMAKKILSVPGAEDDALLFSYHQPIGDSSLYLVDGKAVPYLASFQLHVRSLGSGRTQVEIITHQPEVIAGETSGFMRPHGPANIYVDVAPTTIEEYEILLRLGQELKVDDMPPLRLPR